ncbi:fimbrial protein [Dysgonomonas termitidis]|uniref:Fimbrial protein n=1 Tax=Dysgonomonas termitidis TaxID=1516126 RepID=A0ABV9KUV8_9BACT
MRYRILYLLFISILPLIFSCRSEETDFEPDDISKHAINFTLNIPGLNLPSTYSMDETKENEVNEVDVFIFKVNNLGNQTFIYHKKATNIKNAYGTAKFHAVIEEDTDCNILLVANARTKVDNISSTLTEGVSTKEEVLSLLEYSNEGKWEADGSGIYRNIPMIAETGKINITTGMHITNVSLVRMLARIDLKINASVTPATFKLSNIYLCNYNTNGYIAPTWNSQGELSSAAATSPNLPASTGRKLGTGNAIKYEAGGLTSFNGEIYAFEADAASDDNGYDHADRKNATCLIIEGKYNSASNSSFYRVDFTYPETGTGIDKGDYMPILRNYRYEIEINGVTGAGLPSLEEALASYMVRSNLDIKPIIYDEGLIKDIVFNGRYMLGVDIGEFLSYSGKNLNGTEEASKLVISTDEPEGWKIKISDTNNKTNPDWLKVTNIQGNTGSTQIGLIVNTSAADKAEVGYLDILAGNLVKRITYYSVDPLFEFKDLTDGDIIDFGAENQSLIYNVNIRTNARWKYSASDDTNNNAFPNTILSMSHPLEAPYNIGGTSAQAADITFHFIPSSDDTPVAGTKFATTLSFSTTFTGDSGNDITKTLTFKRTVPAYVGLFSMEPNDIDLPSANSVVKITATANVAWSGIAKYNGTIVSTNSTPVPAATKSSGFSNVTVRENLDSYTKVINFYIKYTDTNGISQESYVGQLIQKKAGE